MVKKFNSITLLAGIILLSLPATLALWHKGFFVTDDGNWMVIRFSAFYEALRFGEFPVRFMPRLNNLYGYPVANFLYPLFMYIGVPVKAIGFSFVNTIKIIFGLSFILSGIFSFLWLKKRFSHISALVGSLIFVYFPYHVVDVYQRGSVGEALALSVAPFVLWQIEEGNIYAEGIGIALLILAHNSLALLFLPIFLLYHILSHTGRKGLLALSLGIVLSTFFWLPALVEKNITVFDTTTVATIGAGFLTLYQLTWIGISTLAIGIISLRFVRKPSSLFILFFVLALLTCCLTLPQSQPVWKLLPFTNLIQFSFRLLSLTNLAVAFLGAYVIESTKRFRWYMVGVIAIAVVLSAMPVLLPKAFTLYPDSYYTTNLDSTTVKNEYMPIWVKTVPHNIPQQKVEVIGGIGKVTLEENRGVVIKALTDFPATRMVQINSLYYPGWRVLVDGKEVPIEYHNTYGVIQVRVSKGVHTIVARFGETPLRIFADGISLLAVLAIIILLARKRYTK